MSQPNRRFTTLVSVFLLAVMVSFAGAGDPSKRPPGKSPQADTLERLLQLAPRIAKIVDKDKDFLAPTRGPVTDTIVERGSLQAVDSSDLICRVRAVSKSGAAAVIKWVIDDGTRVKKGDKVIELEGDGHVEQLRKVKELVAAADAARQRADDEYARVKSENRVDIKLAQIEVRLAELALQQYKGNDAVQKAILETQVERAVLLVDKIKLQGVPKEAQANDLLKARMKAQEQVRQREAELEKDIANCVMTAPRDGIVVYYVPEQTRFGSKNQQSIVAQGEPVRETQKLVSIADLTRMAANTRIHESVIHKVRAGQKVNVRVDAFPGKTFTGKVSESPPFPAGPIFLPPM